MLYCWWQHFSQRTFESGSASLTEICFDELYICWVKSSLLFWTHHVATCFLYNWRKIRFLIFILSWSQTVIVSFRHCIEIKWYFCNRRHYVWYNACRFQWNHKENTNGQWKTLSSVQRCKNCNIMKIVKRNKHQ